MIALRTQNLLFYTIKPLIPRPVQLFVRRRVAAWKRRKYAHIWPIDPNSGRPPEGWTGWPGGRQFALVLSHDVDTLKGCMDVLKLADLEESMGFRSSFNFVPERYGKVPPALLAELRGRGFDICVHGLKHDGKLFRSKEIFDESAKKINVYMQDWGARGFTAPSMLRRHEWMHTLDMDYCVSTFDTDPFEPQPEGAGTIFPFWVANGNGGKEFLELPYTLPQDSTLYIILQERGIDIWKCKLDWIAEKGGMALLNSHPDYMNFSKGPCGPEGYPVRFYTEFLEYVRKRHDGRYWHALPSQVSSVWSASRAVT